MPLDAVLARIDATLPAALDRLCALLRIPSVSTDPTDAADCARAADWLAADLRGMGFDAASRATPGHPIVVGHAGVRDAGTPHLLFYGHYDVQPVDPLALWTHDPFDPKVLDTPRGRVIRARGASDDKGQLMTFVEACRAWKAVTGHLPGHLTVVLEGEEESDSPSLEPFLSAHAGELSADLALICDTGLFVDGSPAIVTQLRGGASCQITIAAAARDLHSGSYGGLAVNPIAVLARLLAGLHDAEGRVTLPGFYDDVTEVPAAQLAQWQALGFDASAFLAEVGLSVPAGETGRSPLERLWSRPTAEVNGIWGGYTGPGFKTVVPAEAHARISFRLVGVQDPAAVLDSLRRYIEAGLPDDCRLAMTGMAGATAARMDTGAPAFAAARAALTEEWGRPAAFIGEGGSIPVTGLFRTILGMESLLVGFARDDDMIHAPNEKYDVESFRKGIRSWARILARLA